jgi:hypothetical protein
MAKFVRIERKLMFGTWRCEDYLIIDAWLTISKNRKIDGDVKLKNIDEMFFGEAALMLTAPQYQVIQTKLKEGSFTPLPRWVNSHSDDYSTEKGLWKYQQRKTMMEYLKSMNATDRQDFISRQHDECMMIPEHENPTEDWDYVKAKPFNPKPALTVEEKANRASKVAKEAQTASKVETKTDEPSTKELMEEIRLLRSDMASMMERFDKVFR